MRAGVSAGLLGVIVEVTLTVFGGVLADDFDGVLVCTDCTVGTEAVELALCSARLDD